MSHIENMLTQLVNEAEAHNPKSEAALLFRKIMAQTNIEVTSKMTDSKCNQHNTAFENFDNPESIFEAFDSINACNIGKAIELGLSEDADIDNEITASLNIEFARIELFDFEEKFEHTLTFKRENLLFLEQESTYGVKLSHDEKRLVKETLKEIFNKQVLECDLDDCNIVLNEGGYVDEIVISIDFSGKEYIVKELLIQGMNDKRLSLSENMLP